MTPLFAAVALTIGFLGLLPDARAYVPPAGFILKNVAAQHGNVSGARIRSSLVLFKSEKSDDSETTEAQFKVIHVFHSESKKMRSTLLDETGREVYRFERTLSPSSLSLNVPAQMVGAILLDSHPRFLTQVLRKEGIEISEGSGSTSEQVFLARWNKAIAWVFGERGDDSVAQLWIEKDTFLPLRWRGETDIQFENYQSQKDYFYPRVIRGFVRANGKTALEDRKPVFKESLIELKLNPAELSKVSNSGDRSLSETGLTDFGNSLSPGLKARIQLYFEAK